jgi:hypothetical protein
MKDLILLVPDKNMQYGLDALLRRPQALGIRLLTFDIYIHPNRDPGIIHDSVNFIRQFSRQYSYAILFFDHEGCGQELQSPEIICNLLKDQIERNGWPNRTEIISLIPEFEAWIWVDSKQLASLLGWGNNLLPLRQFLNQQGFWDLNSQKPTRPKEALQLALKSHGIPRSSSIYKEIAENIEFTGCQDKSFGKFISILQRWFPR